MMFLRWLIVVPAIALSCSMATAGTLDSLTSLRSSLLHPQNPIRLPGGRVIACLWNDDNSLILSPLRPVSQPDFLPLSFTDCPEPPRVSVRDPNPDAKTSNPTLVESGPVLVGSERDRELSPLDKLIAPPGLGEEKQSIGVAKDELELRTELMLLAPNLLYRGPSGRAELDRILTDFRNHEDRSSSGLWKLRLAYHGATQIISEVAPPLDDVLAANREIVEDWVKERPQSPTPYIFLAEMLRNHALAVLRNPMESTNHGRWDGGTSALAGVRAYLVEHKEVASSDPNWYALMIEVMGLQGEASDAILRVLDEAVHREPLYYDTYFAAERAIVGQSKQPVIDLDNLANYAISKTSSIEGTSLYARLYWIALREIGDPEFFAAMTQRWSRMQKSISDVLARYPDQWNIQNFAYFACLAQDKPTSRSLLSKVQGRRFAQAWGQLEVEEACQQWAASEDPPLPTTRASAAAP